MYSPAPPGACLGAREVFAAWEREGPATPSARLRGTRASAALPLPPPPPLGGERGARSRRHTARHTGHGRTRSDSFRAAFKLQGRRAYG
eukprot:3956368-Pyramimonas_sp.AAC.1